MGGQKSEVYHEGTKDTEGKWMMEDGSHFPLLVIALVANKKISQGRGAELLDMNRWDFMDLMARYNVPTVDMKIEELGKGVENLRTNPKGMYDLSVWLPGQTRG